MATEITAENYEELVLKSDKPVLVDFYAEWCGPCKMLTPVLESLSEDFKETAEVYKVNVDLSRELASDLRIMSIPAVLIFKNGEQKHRLIGVQEKSVYKDALNSLI
jgi:thioredoxin 1